MLTNIKELSTLAFESKEVWRLWLAENHGKSAGVWLKLAKKASGINSVTYDEALEDALCYGWIDGQKKSYDEKSWLQKFTPRGKKSIWSKVNKGKVERLLTGGLMQEAGLAAVEVAKQNGQWDAAYDSQSKITVPEDFQQELDKNEPAKTFFESLNNGSRYSFLFRIQTAKKAETRSKRIDQFIKILEKGEKIH